VSGSNYTGWRRQRGWDPVEVVRAEGSRFWGSDGREYLDFASQLVASNLGHSNGAVIQAISGQLQRSPYVSPAFSTPTRAELSELLREVLPRGLERFFFSVSGTEANEAALKIARDLTGRSQVVARRRGYHGATAASLSVSGDPRRERSPRSAAVPGTVFAPDCYCYRCPFGLTYPSCGVRCAEEVAEVIDSAGDVAAMIVEPVVGTNGVIVPVPEYLPRLRQITRDRGVLLIADEVMTGWGRTGQWFAVDHWGIQPDILTTAKGITGGYYPLGLTATTAALHDRYSDRFFPHGHTYEAHPVALAAAQAAITEYRRLKLVERSRDLGEYLRRSLEPLAANHPSIGEIRSLGLFAAIELVRDRGTREPLNTPAEYGQGPPLVVDRVVADLRQRGVHALGWVDHLILAPPLIVEREEIDRGVTAIDQALTIADAAARSG
jgi:taurine--2-oxoglutarate transaminase